MAYFEFKNGSVLKRLLKGEGNEEGSVAIVDPTENPVATRVLDLCSHHGVTAVGCNPDESRGFLAVGPNYVDWVGDGLDIRTPSTPFRDEIDREHLLDRLGSWMGLAKELERLFKGFDDVSVLGRLSLAVSFDGKKIGVLVYRGETVLAEYTSAEAGALLAREAPLSERLDAWAEDLLTVLRGLDFASLDQISIREGHEALFLKGWVLSVKEGDLPSGFPGGPALAAVRRGFSALLSELGEEDE